MLTQNLGYPRIGSKRELKKACENYWAGKISEGELILAGRSERKKNWQIQIDEGIDIIPCNDFSFYDHVQDLNLMFGVIPERFNPLLGDLSEIDLYFSMCRGYQNDQFDIQAMEMTKWFNTNYHYLVPEFTPNQDFRLANRKIINEFLEAKGLGVEKPKPVIIGPLSYLLLGKIKGGQFSKLSLVDKLLPVYFQILSLLQENGCKYIQFDEPFLVTELSEEIQKSYIKVYNEIAEKFPDLTIILATYFDDLAENTQLAASLPIQALHIDLTTKPKQLDKVLQYLPKDKILSLGLIDGRNIWRNNYEYSLKTINAAIKKISINNLWIAPSCSLLHCPYDLDLEKNEKSVLHEIKKWLAFSRQKLKELNILKQLMVDKNNHFDEYLTELVKNAELFAEKKLSGHINKKEVKDKLDFILDKSIYRSIHFEQRIVQQNEKLQLPLFPTTTIGSLPQTRVIRKKRREYKNGSITKVEYDTFIANIIESAVRWQEEIGLDVLVHGEFERNDMVEYFGELLEGFAFTENGWVQSYGSRAVKPPIIFGDVSRKEPLTVKWIKYAQSLSSKPMKGMLTGPVTILQWSFVRDDQPRNLTAFQIANALREEVLDLESAGIKIIQIDEPAFREGLSLKKHEWNNYLEWAVKAFKICYWGIKNSTQIHTHMCYSEFNDIIEAIAAMDADVISIETARSQLELLNSFKNYGYPNQIGPGVYDIHSPRIPSVAEMQEMVLMAEKLIPPQNIWINPDCGLKTRNWDEVKPALENMVKAADKLRKNRKVKTDFQK